MIDLKELMQERSERIPSLDGMRITQVRRRIAVRRRRFSTVAITVVVLVLFGGYLSAAMPERPMAPGVVTLGELPQFAYGGKLTLSARSPLDDPVVRLAWRPAVPEFVVVVYCVTGLANAVRSALRVSSTTTERLERQPASRDDSGGCELPQGEPFFMRAAANAEVAMSVRVSLLDAVRPLPAGEMALGVYEPVPFAAFPLPARPAKLKPLPRAVSCLDGQTLLRSGADPRAPVSGTVIWQEDLLVQLLSQTPGEFTIEVDSAALAVLPVWDYLASPVHLTWRSGDPLSSWLPPAPGTPAVITVSPAHATGGWALAALPAGSLESTPVPAYC